MYPQFEAAKIEELKDMPSIEIIDNPRLAGIRSYPKRGLICVVAAFIGFFVSLGLALIKEALEQNHEVIIQIRNTFFNKKNNL